MSRILNSIPLLYVLMLFPGRLSIWDIFHGTWYYPQMMSESGQLSIWYLILTLAVTPMLMVINRVGRGAAIGIWLLRRRKHFGLGSFIFATVHALHYIRDTGDLGSLWFEAFYIEILVGWLALVIFLVLALTSNRASTRRLGRWWKPLHRFVYLAAALSFLHWYLFDWNTERVMLWVGIFCTIKLGHGLIKRTPRRAAPPVS